MKYISVILITTIHLFLAVSSQGTTLAVPERIQEHSEWCWSGTSQAILNYYGQTPTQCQIANWAWSRSDCCGNSDFDWSHLCNQSNYMYGTSGSLQNILIHWGVSNTARAYALSQNTVTSEIAAGRPFVIRWGWTGGGGHFVDGRGIDGSTVHYMDPWPGNGYESASYSWVVNDGSHTWTHSLQVTTNPSPSETETAPLQLFAGDFDGDSYSDLTVFRPSSGLWLVRGVTRTYLGTNGDIPIPADFNGDGTSDFAIFRPSTGLWKIKGLTRFYHGKNGDIPIPMHYDNAGGATACYYRPSTSLWNTKGGYRVYFGQSGDLPVPGPYTSRDGTRGAVNYAIFRPSNGLWIIKGYTRIYFGQNGDIPVPGDYQSSSTIKTRPWQPAIFRPSTGLWKVRNITRFFMGQSGDIPVPADYLGGWGDEAAYFRPSSKAWQVRGAARIYFGLSSDIPATR